MHDSIGYGQQGTEGGGMTGLDKHKPDCSCAACAGRRGAEAQRTATAELEATRRDTAWMTVMDMGGPDAVLAKARQWGDQSRALRLLEAAGYGAQIAGQPDRPSGTPSSTAPAAAYASPLARDPVRRQASAQLGDWGPDHDERVTAALLGGASDAELARIRAGVHAEYAGRALEREARRREYYGLDRMPAAMGASVNELGVPVQKSMIHADVPELGE